MAPPIEITPDNQIPLLLQTKKDEIDERRKVDHLIEIKETIGQDPSGSQTNKSINQIFDKRFETLDNSSIESTTIFKVTVGLSESNPDAYKPKLISIGPYYNTILNLARWKKYKLRYLQRFLKRKGGMDVQSCMSEMDKLKDAALKCYDDLGDLDNILVNFSEMLLLDGCFVVEHIREHCGMKPKGEDMIIKTICIVNQVHRDLLLLENQLPFFVLTKLHEMTKEDKISFTKLVQDTFLAKLPKMTPAPFLETEGNEKNIKHLLHLVHMPCHPSEMKTSLTRNPSMGAENSGKGLCGIPLQIGVCTRAIPNETKPKTSPAENSSKSSRGIPLPKIRKNDMPRDKESIPSLKVMPNATELLEAGVRFVKVGYNYSAMEEHGTGDSTSLFDIKFDHEMMKITSFKVTDVTETLLRNLIAYEQQTSDVHSRYFTDFAIMMNYLIDSEKDVNLLCRRGIIENWIGDNKEVASIFKKIGKGISVSLDNFYYKEECRKIIQHYEKPLNRMKANLMHKYFNSSWAWATCVFLILTTTQTILAFTGSIK